VVIAVLLALVAAPPDEHSILVDREYEIERFLHALPQSGSYAGLLEDAIQPAVYSNEESGGFADIDPHRLSIHGDSVLWTRWYLERH